jgi:hypothetical protein
MATLLGNGIEAKVLRIGLEELLTAIVIRAESVEMGITTVGAILRRPVTVTRGH